MCSLDKVGVRISDLIKNYTDEVKEGLEDRLDKTQGSGANKVIYISSGTKGRLVHLVELGFKHVSGKFVEARPFMRPAYEMFTPDMLEDIKKIIENGGK